MKKIALHWKIIIGMTLGIVWGLLAGYAGLGEFNTNWIKPFGSIFVNLLKLIAIPLIVVSLIKGVSSLSDVSKLTRIGGKTITIYITTTVIAIVVGLILVNTASPGKFISPDKRDALKQQYVSAALKKQQDADTVKKSGPLRFIEDIVPDNIFKAATSNRNMLQLIFFSLMFGIAILMVPPDKTEVLRAFFDGANEVILRIIDMIMNIAPFGVFALLGSIIVDFAGDNLSRTVELFISLGLYALVTITGMFILVLAVYPLILRFFTKIKFSFWIKAIMPAQMLAFSTSSSAATLPVTMECCEKNLGISEEVTSFVLPLGATVNMDGTSLYQAVSAVFIAQAFGIDLSLMQQLTIVVTATLASIGAAAVPGAGIVMLVIVLGAIGIDESGIALVFAVERILDMFRTVVNITGDTVVASLVATSENSLVIPAAD